MSQPFVELIHLLDTRPELTAERIAGWMQSLNLDEARNGYALQTAWHVRGKQWDQALEVLAQAQARFPVLPPPLFELWVHLRVLSGQSRHLPRDFLEYGVRAVENGLDDLGCEAIGNAFVEDADQYLELIYDKAALRAATNHYETVVQRLFPALGATRYAPPPTRKLRVGLLVANLVDDVVAYSKRVLDFARHVDTGRVELRVYSSENLCVRQRLLPARCLAQPSPDWAPQTLAELAQRQIPVFLAPRNLPITQAALALARQIAGDQIDLLVMQSGPTMPIDWLAARLAPTPAKVHIHIGAPNYMPGMDLTIFDNAVNLEREREGWPAHAGELRLVRQGTDIEGLRALPPAARGSYGLPETAILIGVLSNHLDRRLSSEYLAVIGQVLHQEPRAWFVPIGQKELPPHARAFFEKENMLARVRHIPVQRQPARILKMLDIYANEFPVGGSQAVVEAMACGLPVAAMRAGPRHVESAGADIVGPPWAIEQPDPEAYRALIQSWVEAPDQRRAAGHALRERADAQFSIHDYVRQICEIGVQLVAQKERK